MNLSTTSSVLNFNGNDPIGLFKGSELVDIIGVFNSSANFALDKTLRRNTTMGNINYVSSEWDIITSLAYIPIVGLDVLFEAKHDIMSLYEIFSHLFLGIQMMDDIEDFNKDSLSGQWTYAQSKVQEFIVLEQIEKKYGLDRFNERVLYVSGIGNELMEYAKQEFFIAREKAVKLSLSNLIKWIDEVILYLIHNENLIHQLTK